jgi:TetR/AcrR family acrAB operon transcriptional repressor
MARKTKAEAAVTREQLLDAAERVFRDRGVSAASLGEVASAAGVTRGAVYWHFRDKADLIGALCERVTLPLDTIFQRLRHEASDDPVGSLRLCAIASLTHLARDPRAQAVFQLMHQNTGIDDELAPLASAHERERDACLRNVEELVGLAITAGQLHPDTDPRLAAHALHAYVSGLMQAWVRDPAAYDLAAAAPALVDAMLTGLRATPPRRAAANAGAIVDAAD